MRILKWISRGLLAAEDPVPKGKSGCRAYAIGDIHGRLDLLEEMLRRIEQDRAGRPARRTFVIFLGDLIDRGPESARVVERLRNYRPQDATPVFLMGNHEEVLLRILAGERGILPSWLKFGGSECARSYGVYPDARRQSDVGTAIRIVQSAVPTAHRTFLESFGDTFRFGDYLFVHAGIRPGVAIEEQNRTDLRWIREPFLTDSNVHGCMVVHGHTIVTEVEERRNRIGIDTGAYQTGILTALAVEDEQRWFITTAPEERISTGFASAA